MKGFIHHGGGGSSSSKNVFLKIILSVVVFNFITHFCTVREEREDWQQQQKPTPTVALATTITATETETASDAVDTSPLLRSSMDAPVSTDDQDKTAASDNQKEAEASSDSLPQTQQESSTPAQLSPNCVWTPNENNCTETLRQRFPYYPENLRFLVIGDSTMHFLYMASQLRNLSDTCPGARDELRRANMLTDAAAAEPAEPNCREPVNRCQDPFVYDSNETEKQTEARNGTRLAERLATWVPPQKGLEGPVLNGLIHPYCTDCDGCLTRMHPVRGGFLGIEFARDVVRQTPVYRTSQESILHGLTTWWKNISDGRITRDLCLVNTGHHDAAIPNITKEQYVINAKEYVQLLLTQACTEGLVWISTTAPMENDPSWPQTKKLTVEWNDAIRDQVLPGFTDDHNIVFVDVYEASLYNGHTDNIHLHWDWYKRLGDYFVTIFL